MRNGIPQLYPIQVTQIGCLPEDIQLGVADHPEVIDLRRHQVSELVLVELLDLLLLRYERGVKETRLLL